MIIETKQKAMSKRRLLNIFCNGQEVIVTSVVMKKDAFECNCTILSAKVLVSF